MLRGLVGEFLCNGEKQPSKEAFACGFRERDRPSVYFFLFAEYANFFAFTFLFHVLLYFSAWGR